MIHLGVLLLYTFPFPWLSTRFCSYLCNYYPPEMVTALQVPINLHQLLQISDLIDHPFPSRVSSSCIFSSGIVLACKRRSVAQRRERKCLLEDGDVDDNNDPGGPCCWYVWVQSRTRVFEFWFWFLSVEQPRHQSEARALIA